MTSSGSGSLETSEDSTYQNFSFSITSTNNQFMTTSFSNSLTTGNNIYSGSYLNRDRINVNRIGSGGVPKFKSITPPSLPISSPSSSYFSIPPGLSPAELLDSPVLLSASNILPSPTTGTLSSHLSYNWKGDSNDFQQQKTNQESRNDSDFSFQPQPKPKPNSTFLPSSTTISPEQPWNSTTSQELTSTNVKSEFPSVLERFSPEISTILQSDYNPNNCQTLGEKRRSEDGFNWRKYGQKQVKGSENPRSYYKCTYPNCSTKKKVERSLDGEITEIVYKGSHNHPMPQFTRRKPSSSSSHQIQTDSALTSSISDHQFISTSETTTNQMEVVVVPPENSSISVGDEDIDERSQRNKSGGDEFDEDEPDSKRWKRESENEGISGVGSNRVVREPRVVVQTTSDIDILIDGYRWRKYGQKVVKGNPNPRSYYKCTSSGCQVRKHVERASNDVRSVITTYEGKHNHDVPAPRGSGNINRLTPATPSTLIRPHSSLVTTNMAHSNGTRTTGQTPFVLEMLQSSGSFGFSGFSSPPGSSSFKSQQQQQKLEDVYSKTKEEVDTFLDTLLY